MRRRYLGVVDETAAADASAASATHPAAAAGGRAGDDRAPSERHDAPTAGTTAPAPLDVRDVTVRFAGLTALDAVGFTVGPGTVHAVIGPNGAGKSTCFNVLSGVYRATSGSVRFGDAELTGLPRTASPASASPAPSRTSPCRRAPPSPTA